MTNILQTAVEAAIEAGKAIMKIYEQDFSVEFKDDKSPLTEADKASNTLICNRLADTFPIISEENKQIDFEERKHWNKYWLIDPIDGTKEFIKKNGEFTVNIALVEKGLPVLGVVYLPAKNILYFGSSEIGSYKYTVPENQSLTELDEIINNADKLTGDNLPEKYTIVASRSHMSPETEEFIAECREKYGEVELISKGSSIKLCLVAEGSAHVYPRVAPTMEWDTAAAHAVAKFAGCTVKDFYNHTELKYNKENLLNPYFIVAHEG
ncbi:MAG: 3'(2'),5'-bisphosphate nucleotidase CysQ [Moheibacter sp.]